ncbi:MAG: protein phosphatase CheZ [Burkholderiales bacterium]
MSELPISDDTRQQLGTIVRQLHDALQTLGYDTVLHEVAQEIPDARERLAYVGRMTESAAHRVLSLVDQAQPGCTALANEGEVLLASAPTAPEPLLAFARKSVEGARAQHGVLSEIMLTQDFQDLSGQVINKVIQIISRTEEQLVELLLHSAPGVPAKASTELAGPQVPDKALKQDDVDDLLASMGF